MRVLFIAGPASCGWRVTCSRVGRLDAVEGPCEVNVHDHQVGPMRTGQRNGLLARRRLAHGIVAETQQLPLEVSRDDPFVLNNQYSRSSHSHLCSAGGDAEAFGAKTRPKDVPKDVPRP